MNHARQTMWKRRRCMLDSSLAMFTPTLLFSRALFARVSYNKRVVGQSNWAVQSARLDQSYQVELRWRDSECEIKKKKSCKWTKDLVAAGESGRYFRSDDWQKLDITIDIVRSNLETRARCVSTDHSRFFKLAERDVRIFHFLLPKRRYSLGKSLLPRVLRRYIMETLKRCNLIAQVKLGEARR